MPHWLHRTTKQYIKSVASADLPEAQANYIEYPDLSAVAGQPVKYWVITGDVVTLADQATRDAIDAQELSDRLDAIAAKLDLTQDFQRAFALALLDELNSHADKINAILTAIDNATNLAGLKAEIATIADYPQRTIAQMKTAVRGKLGS